LGLNIRFKGTFATNIYTPLDREWFSYNNVVGSFTEGNFLADFI